MTKPEISLAIVGGGAACILFLAHLARRNSAKDFRIDVYDRSGRFGKGIAYSTRSLSHLLNVRAANMSAFAQDKDDFALWSEAKGFKPADFVPRKLYANYLSDKLAATRETLNIRLIEKDVTGVIREAMAYTLFCGTEKTTYDQVILATGNVCPLRPKTDGDVGRYFEDPWAVNFASLKTIDHIGLVGSGLTAMDALLSLNEAGYAGEVSVFSRNGLFPQPHVDPVPYDSVLTSADEKLSPLRLLHKIRSEIRVGAQRNVPWQSVIDSLRPHTNKIWLNWTGAERDRFQKRLLTFWNIHRHRMAPQIAAMLDDYKAKGRLHIIKAGVEQITTGPNIVCKGTQYKMDAVINCLGYRYQERGRTFDVDYKIGPARFGELFETTAIPEIRAQASELAALLAP